MNKKQERFFRDTFFDMQMNLSELMPILSTEIDLIVKKITEISKSQETNNAKLKEFKALRNEIEKKQKDKFKNPCLNCDKCFNIEHTFRALKADENLISEFLDDYKNDCELYLNQWKIHYKEQIESIDQFIRIIEPKAKRGRPKAKDLPNKIKAIFEIENALSKKNKQFDFKSLDHYDRMNKNSKKYFHKTLSEVKIEDIEQEREKLVKKAKNKNGKE